MIKYVAELIAHSVLSTSTREAGQAVKLAHLLYAVIYGHSLFAMSSSGLIAPSSSAEGKSPDNT